MWQRVAVKLLPVFVIGKHVAGPGLPLYLVDGNNAVLDDLGQHRQPVARRGFAVHLVDEHQPLFHHNAHLLFEPEQRIAVHRVALHILARDDTLDQRQPVLDHHEPQQHTLEHGAVLFIALNHDALVFVGRGRVQPRHTGEPDPLDRVALYLVNAHNPKLIGSRQ